MLTRHLAVSCAAIFCTAAVHAATDDYLAAVQADVDEFTSGKFVTPEQSAWVGGNATASADDGTASLEAFESFLKKRFPGTYILFAGLNPAQKTVIWKDYLKTGDLGGVRTNIFAVRSGRSTLSTQQSITNLPKD